MALFEQEGKKNYEDFEKFNRKQTELEQLLERKLPILDSCQIRITAQEHISIEIKEKIDEINSFLFDLQKNKVSSPTFEQRSIDIFTDIRMLRIQTDNTTVQMRTLENFCEKYVPLQTMNSISRTLHGFLTPTQLARLEDYEYGVFADLHSVILSDDGEPHLNKEKEKIVREISEKLDVLKQLYQERHLTSKLTGGNLWGLTV